MLKSTKEKIHIGNVRNELLGRQLDIEEEFNDKKIELLKNGLATRNRVDISLQEYEELKHKKETLEKELSSTQKVLNKMVQPFIDNNINPEIYNKICNGEFICKIKQIYNAETNTFQLALIYEIQARELYEI